MRRRSSRARCPWIAAWAVLSTACGTGGDGAGPDAEAIGSSASPIAGGVVDEDDTAVVGFFNVADGSMCSGTIIAPNVVLTARHCVSPTIGESAGGGVVCNITTFGDAALPSAFFVGTPTSINVANVGEFLVEEVVGLPGDDPAFCGRDVAILILDDVADPSVAVPIEPRIDQPLAPGDEYSAVGYGATDDAGTGSGTRRRRDGLFVECVGSECGLTQVTAEEWRGDIGVCHGDSGGPALDADGRVAGVTSRGTMGCDDPIYGDTFSRASWLKDTVAYASGIGQYAPPAWTAGTSVDPAHSAPVGVLCEASTECFTGFCIGPAGSSYCTRPCDDAATCPTDYVCAAAGPNGELVCSLPGADPGPAPPPPPSDDDGCAIGHSGGRWAGGLLVTSLLIGTVAARRRRRLG